MSNTKAMLFPGIQFGSCTIFTSALSKSSLTSPVMMGMRVTTSASMVTLNKCCPMLNVSFV